LRWRTSGPHIIARMRGPLLTAPGDAGNLRRRRK
jgi:hypothetical protein